MRGSPEPLRKWASVTMPTLVMDGGKSPAFMHSGAQALTNILPNAQHRHFPDQDHGVAEMGGTGHEQRWIVQGAARLFTPGDARLTTRFEPPQ